MNPVARFDPERLMRRRFAQAVHDYSERDTMLYALGVGLGNDPMKRDELRFVFERDLLVLTTMATVLATPGFWSRAPDTGIDWKAVLHGEQRLRIHNALPAAGRLVGETIVEAVADKGAGKGSMVHTRRELHDAATGELLCTLRGTTVCRNNGGHGSVGTPPRPSSAPPQRAADLVCDLPTLPQSALIYRLSGDYNPLHADPDLAAQAGFPRPILHGMCTFGIAGHALLRTLCAYDPARLVEMELRFSSPVYPGETVRTEIWKLESGAAAFRCSVPARGRVVADRGAARYLG